MKNTNKTLEIIDSLIKGSNNSALVIYCLNVVKEDLKAIIDDNIILNSLVKRLNNRYDDLFINYVNETKELKDKIKGLEQVLKINSMR